MKNPIFLIYPHKSADSNSSYRKNLFEACKWLTTVKIDNHDLFVKNIIPGLAPERSPIGDYLTMYYEYTQGTTYRPSDFIAALGEGRRCHYPSETSPDLFRSLTSERTTAFEVLTTERTTTLDTLFEMFGECIEWDNMKGWGELCDVVERAKEHLKIGLPLRYVPDVRDPSAYGKEHPKWKAIYKRHNATTRSEIHSDLTVSLWNQFVSTIGQLEGRMMTAMTSAYGKRAEMISTFGLLSEYLKNVDYCTCNIPTLILCILIASQRVLGKSIAFTDLDIPTQALWDHLETLGGLDWEMLAHLGATTEILSHTSKRCAMKIFNHWVSEWQELERCVSAVMAPTHSVDLYMQQIDVLYAVTTVIMKVLSKTLGIESEVPDDLVVRTDIRKI